MIIFINRQRKKVFKVFVPIDFLEIIQLINRTPHHRLQNNFVCLFGLICERERVALAISESFAKCVYAQQCQQQQTSVSGMRAPFLRDDHAVFKAR